LLGIITEFDLDARHVDVKGAYLQAKLKEEVYMRQPTGFIDERYPKRVCKLLKSIYGLRQAGHEWFIHLRNWLISLGFIPFDDEETMYRKKVDGKVAIVVWHVDDGLLAASRGWIEKILRELNSGELEVVDLGEPTSLLNCKIERNRSEGWIKISQPGYIDALVGKLGLEHAHTAKAPTSGELLKPRSGEETQIDTVSYLEVVGSLNWCAVATRPDISFAVSHLASFSTDPCQRHMNAAKNVVRYLKGTRDVGITYRRGVSGVRGWSDSDWAMDERDRKSITGWVFFFAGGPILWRSQKQTLVTLSSMESEFVAVNDATVTAVWLHRLLSDIASAVPIPLSPIPLGLDNQSAEAFIKRNHAHQRTKYIDTRGHFVANMEEKGHIKIEHPKPSGYLHKTIGSFKTHHSALIA
jgi:hypothetical protein